MAGGTLMKVHSLTTCGLNSICYVSVGRSPLARSPLQMNYDDHLLRSVGWRARLPPALHVCSTHFTRRKTHTHYTRTH